jgi:hypothetical protein
VIYKAIAAGCVAMLIRLTAVAGPIDGARPSAAMTLMRDSDGMVISVIRPVEYGTWPTWIERGVIYYTMGGQVLDFSGAPGGVTTGGTDMASVQTTTPTVAVDGTTYTVEAQGAEIWLIDPATGQRHATQRRVAGTAPDAAGHTVNPTAFKLE